MVPLAGPVSLLLALAASGLNGQTSPSSATCRRTPTRASQRIRELEALALRTGQTQLLIETPYRNAALLQALLQTLQHDTRLAVARGLTLAAARCAATPSRAGAPSHCRPTSALPAVFAIGR